MTLTLDYRGQATVPLEVEGLTPEVAAQLSLAEIEKFEVFHGNEKQPLAEFFDVSGDPSDQHHLWKGDLSGVHWIGTKMTSGRVDIESNAGRHLGSEMRGGEIHVAGDAGDWVGAEMRGGLIQIRGNAGHLVGAGYRGSARGMNRGTILVHGNAGNEIGHTMRRGLVAIGGDSGDLIGFNMLAGTIIVCGQTGIRHGAGMRRGTIGFFGPDRPPLLPSFKRACRFRPDFMNLLVPFLDQHDFPLPPGLHEADFELFHGDLIEGGRGEMLLVEA